FILRYATEPHHDALALAVPLLRALRDAREGLETYCSDPALGAERLRHIIGVLGMAEGFGAAFPDENDFFGIASSATARLEKVWAPLRKRARWTPTCFAADDDGPAD